MKNSKVLNLVELQREHNNNNNPICKAPECQKTSVALTCPQIYQ